MRSPSLLAAEPDHYAVLKVLPQASMKEIRGAFKRLVLEAHPDKNPGRREWSERRIRELIAAFDVLGNEESRAAFDIRRQARAADARNGASGAPPRKKAAPAAEPFYFRKKDPESRALLILHYLLHRKARPAVLVLREMEDRLGGDFLRTYLDRDDYLDCLFLLAEFYTTKRDYLKAAEHLHRFYSHERLSKFPRHYIDEVVRLLKDLYLRKIPRSAGAEIALEGLREAGEMRLTRAEEGLRLRKMAEIYFRTGDMKEARRAIDRAEKLFPLSKDMERIRKRIDAAG